MLYSQNACLSYHLNNKLGNILFQWRNKCLYNKIIHILEPSMLIAKDGLTNQQTQKTFQHTQKSFQKKAFEEFSGRPFLGLKKYFLSVQIRDLGCAEMIFAWIHQKYQIRCVHKQILILSTRVLNRIKIFAKLDCFVKFNVNFGKHLLEFEQNLRAQLCISDRQQFAIL
ncbi:hypothetical protein BpHYR1_013288 [Brachionus plicatilis]|uniref:Uncharacterized protein n=1 Tax=Brachionus plicatilis TaxID=10195 RepID=A0A3M7RW42_BRAPC|nr:hypothetical protein BpHYR1_013288 [Brachionus plicatilis]